MSIVQKQKIRGDFSRVDQNISTDISNSVPYRFNMQDEQLFKHSPAMFIRWEAPNYKDIIVVDVSSNISKLGFTADEILSGTVDWAEQILPEDFERVAKAILQRVKDGANTYTISYRILDKHNQVRWLEDFGTIIRSETGSVLYLQTLMFDITERKQTDLDLQQKNNYIELLYTMSISLMNTTDERELVTAIVTKAQQLLNTKNIYLYLRVDDSENYRFTAGTNLFNTRRFKLTIDSSYLGVVGDVLRTQQPRIVTDYKNWSQRSPLDFFDTLEVVGAVPLISNSKLIGVLGYGHEENEPKVDHSVLVNFAQLAASTLDSKYFYDRTQDGLEKQHLLEKDLKQERDALAEQIHFRSGLSQLLEDFLTYEPVSTNLLNPTSSITASNMSVACDVLDNHFLNHYSYGHTTGFYQTILEKAVAIFPNAEAGSLIVKQNSENYMFKATVGYDLKLLSRVRLTQKEFFRDLSDPNPLFLYNANNGHLDPKTQTIFKQAAPQTFAVVLTIPIYVNGQPIAMFSLDNMHDKNAFSQEALHLAEIFANQISALWQRLLLEVNLQRNNKQYKDLFLEANGLSRELSLCNKLQEAIANKLELNELFDTTTKSIVGIFGYAQCNIGIIKNNYLQSVSYSGYTEQFPSIVDITNKDSVVYRTIKTGQGQVMTRPVTKDSTQHINQDGILLIPIFYQGSVYGILGVEHSSQQLTETDKSIMAKVSALLSTAIENAQLHSQVKKESALSNANYKISHAIQNNNNPEDFLKVIVHSICEALSASWCNLHKIDFVNESIDYIVSSSPEALIATHYEQLKSGLSGIALEKKEVLLINKSNVVTHIDKNSVRKNYNSQVSAQGKIIRQKYNHGTTIIAPLYYHKRLLGLLIIINHIDKADFTLEDTQLAISIARKTSSAIAQYELKQKVEHQAYHDSLTNLPNRLFFESRIEKSLADASETQTLFAILFLDLDGFKNVNDTLGHDIGDTLLKVVGQRLKGRTRSEDSLARMGGDEFAIILNNLKSKEEALQVGNDYLSLFQGSFQIGVHPITIGVSIGISIFPNDGKDLGTLLKHADSAMYQAKYSGKNSVCSFSPLLAAQTKQRIDLERDLQQAIPRGELELYYQPQVCLATQQTIGLEALLRWHHPKKGFVAPNEFISIAEESKLILDIGNWVLNEACRQNAAWQAQGYEDITVAVNVSARQFESPEFLETVSEALENSGLDPEYLELEVTESVMMQDVTKVIERLKYLQKIGVSIAIDDFGTGYSSMRYLQQLPLNKLKIDRFFISEITASSNLPIVNSMLTLANDLDLITVAEGIESEEQLKLLTVLGCNEAQGFYFAKPLQAKEVFIHKTT